jgi:hypothetical protein
MKKKTKKRIRRFLFWLLFIILFLVGGVSLVAYYYGNRILKGYVIRTIETESKGLYHAEIRGLHINLLIGRISLTGFRLVPDTVVYNRLKKEEPLSPMLFTARIEIFRVLGLDFKKAILDKEISIRRIDIENPDIVIRIYPSPVEPKDTSTTHRMLAVPLPKALVSISIGHVKLKDGKLTVIDAVKTPADTFLIPRINVLVTNFLVDSVHQGKRRIFNSDDITLSLSGLKIKTKNGMYRISSGEIGLSTGRSEAWIGDLKIEPLYSEHDFSRKLGYQTDRMNIAIGRIAMHGLDLRQAMIHRKIIARCVEIEKLNVDNYRDKRVPARKNFFPPLPHQALMKAKVYLRIDSVTVTEGKVSYSEQVGNEPGRLFFDRISGTILNMTNDTEMIRINKTVMSAEAILYLMGKGKLWARIDFPLGAKQDAFTFTGRLDRMELKEINPMVTKLAPAEILGGTITSLYIPPVRATDHVAKGTLDFRYTDLEFHIKTENTTGWSTFKNKVLNFAAGIYVVNNNPNNDGKLTEGIIYFERDRTKGIFNYLWKSTFSGLKSAMHVNTKEQKEIKKEKRKESRKARKKE